MNLRIVFKASAICAAIALSTSVAAESQQALADRSDVTVRGVIAKSLVAQSSRDSGFKWGVESSQRQSAVDQSRARQAHEGFRWASSSERTANDGRFVAKVQGFRWGIRSAAEQQGFRWGIRSASEQQGFRWGIRSASEQQGFRWGIRSASEQQGFRWGIRSASEQQGFRWGIRSSAEQNGFRWGIR